jgi:hypothetical protein
MAEKEERQPSERLDDLERNFKNIQKQIERLTQELMGTITILCLPLSNGRRLEFGFKQIEQLPNHILQIIIQRYVTESKHSDLSFDEMITPIVSVFGFERSWKVLPRETIKDIYGEWALAKWDEMAKSHPCEE